MGRRELLILRGLSVTFARPKSSPGTCPQLPALARVRGRGKTRVSSWAGQRGSGRGRPSAWPLTALSPHAVPELVARGVIQQVFPVHEQRILNRLMKSWVQAICEAQPLGMYSPPAGELGSPPWEGLVLQHSHEQGHCQDPRGS